MIVTYDVLPDFVCNDILCQPMIDHTKTHHNQLAIQIA